MCVYSVGLGLTKVCCVPTVCACRVWRYTLSTPLQLSCVCWQAPNRAVPWRIETPSRVFVSLRCLSHHVNWRLLGTVQQHPHSFPAHTPSSQSQASPTRAWVLGRWTGCCRIAADALCNLVNFAETHSWYPQLCFDLYRNDLDNMTHNCLHQVR